MSRVFGGCRVLMGASKPGRKPVPTKTESALKPKNTESAAKPKNTAGILKPLPVSPSMRKFIGAPEISRAEAIKKIWDHIKLNQLQNPTNKREIHCDEKLKTIFDGRDKVGMLEIASLIAPHFLKSS